MAYAQARVGSSAPHSAVPAAAVPRRTSSRLIELSGLLREVRDATANASRMAMEAEQSGRSS